tara:strand:- start:512 stop:703 length:192 start_codon:yes stop_codon:yes gene_type:complete
LNAPVSTGIGTKSLPTEVAASIAIEWHAALAFWLFITVAAWGHTSTYSSSKQSYSSLRDERFL